MPVSAKIKTALWVLLGIGMVAFLFKVGDVSPWFASIMTLIGAYFVFTHWHFSQLSNRYNVDYGIESRDQPDKEWLAGFVPKETIRKVWAIRDLTYRDQHSIIENAIDVYYESLQDSPDSQKYSH